MGASMSAAKPLILLIEGNRANRPSFREGLLQRDYAVESVPNGAAALAFFEKQKPRAVIVDAASMRTSGTRICTELRKKSKKIPLLLILPEKNNVEVTDIADQVLVMPFTIQKLVNRLNPLVTANKEKILQAGPIRLDLEQRWVYCRGRRARLTPQLFALMEMFMRHAGVVISRDELFTKLWETDYLGDTRSLDVHISWLRQAIEKDPRNPVYLRTERGVGYRLQVEKPTRPRNP
jgi:DNA-binding response OmpR family regulator